MDLLELFSKLADEDDISSESELFDFQEAMSMLEKARMHEIDIQKVDKLMMPLANVAREQLEVLTHCVEQRL